MGYITDQFVLFFRQYSLLIPRLGSGLRSPRGGAQKLHLRETVKSDYCNSL
jgi:hypothetical protein